MRLADDPRDFRGALDAAQENLGIALRQLEKDYWVTAILRAIAGDCREQVLFKGGTSLSKGWGIIERFSEDIDLLLLTAPGDETEVVLNRITRLAEETCGNGGSHIDSELPGLARITDVPFPMLPNTPRARGMRREIRLEPGVRGGPHPNQTVEIRPLVADGLGEQAGDFEDLQFFALEALHPARTLVEKLFALHSMGVTLSQDSESSVRGTQARHFYDVFCLTDPSRSDALAVLQTDGLYEGLLADCEQISQKWFEDRATKRPVGGFSRSPAFTDETLIDRIAPAFEQTLDELCYPKAKRPRLVDICAHVRSIDWL